MPDPMLIARSGETDILLLPRLSNRHGLITGATGTGKTVTLQKMAESFASIGVPVFVADVKGDLSGIAAEGAASPKLMARLAAIGITEFTPRDQKAVKSAAETMRPNPAFDATAAITELGVGEALISFLDEKGRPGITERASVIAPGSRLGPLTDPERTAAIRGSLLYGHYEKEVDRESAYEMLRAQAEAATERVAEVAKEREQAEGSGGGLSDFLFGSTGPRGGKRDGLVQLAAKTVTRTIGSSVGRQIVRGVLGSLFGGRR